ncbi:type II secretion system minor pseudopilin [Lacipirellula limnantheis]|uniref:General secretion pathway protein K n=1 Tax=Lacipirellula limnantheis TaxID=2528024 RepID=A0A517TWA5_9BACT|nr:type II secretion system protein GspK [Lacipirellula limnantheis]QDT72652.1 General secretion pathway protein K [Lacipirellula limnantheis]
MADKSKRRRGSVLFMVLVVVALLTLGTATYLELMQNERQAVRHHGRGLQAGRLAESGVEYARALMSLTPSELLQSGGLASNPTSMQAIVVDDEGDEFDRGRFSIISPAQVDGVYSGYRFGLENESAKLNVNTLLAEGAEEQAQTRLMALPGMTVEIADAILDWLDADASPRTNGGEADAYAQAMPPYEPRNGPIADLDELLLVRGVTPELLYGIDQNRNLLIDAAESPRGMLLEIDNADGLLNRGWSAYLTTTSVEAMQPAAAAASGASTSAGATTLDLNGQNLQTLYNSLKGTIGDDKAKFLIVYRQYGPLQNQQQQGGAGVAGRAGGANAAGAANAGNANAGGGAGGQQGIQQIQDIQAIQDTGGLNNQQGGTPNGSGQQPGGAGGQGQNQNQTPIEIEAAGIMLKYEQQGQTQINSPLDLVGARVQIPAADSNPPQNVDSPWGADVNSYRELLKLYDAAAPPAGVRRVAGRVNLNAASRVVLGSIPGLPAAAVGKIVSRREVEPDLNGTDQRHPVWLLIEGIVTIDEMRQLERYVTSGGDAFSGQAVGFFDAGPAAARQEFVVDRSGTTPHVRLQRDLSPLGRGYSTLSLGVESSDAP